MSDVPDWVQTKIWPGRTRGAIVLSAALYRLGAPRFLGDERRAYLQMSRPRLARECAMRVQALDRAIDDLSAVGFLHAHGAERWDAARGLSVPIDPPEIRGVPPVILGESSSPKSSPSPSLESPKIIPLRTYGGSTDPSDPDQEIDPSVPSRVRAWAAWAADNGCDNPEAFHFHPDILEAQTEQLSQRPPANVTSFWGLLYRRCELAAAVAERQAKNARYDAMRQDATREASRRER